jgi:hypothetical protein
MVRPIISVTSMISIIGCLSGCATQTVSNPSDITLEHALVDTVDALAAAHKEGQTIHSNFGYYGCTITAVFNVSATAGQDNKLSLTASGPPVSVFPVNIGATGSEESTASGTRVNTVTVVLATKPCISKASGGGGAAVAPGHAAPAAADPAANLSDPPPLFNQIRHP